MNISTKTYEVLNTGSIILPSGEYLEFEIEGLRYRISFSEEIEGDPKGQSRVTGALVTEGGNQYLSLNVINYNALFSSPSQLLEMGTLGGRKLYLYFSIVTMSGDNSTKIRVFHYTWYKSKEVSNGTDTNE